jgi:solute carrier family 25 phosphate transporter 3
MTGSTVCQKDPSFYTKAAASGALAACFTHVIMVPLDVVKTRMQLSPTAYPNAATAVRTIRSNEGIRGLTLGLGPTNYGYLTQGAFKYGLYELFKTNFPKLIGQQRAEQNATLLYLAAGMTAEAIADIFLTPFEAVRIRMVSQPGFASGTIAGMRKVVAMEGVRGLYKGFAPLLMKQVPYTAVKLATFEACEEFLYSHLKREEMSNGAQLAVTTVSGFVGGVASAVVSHPADTMLTKINVTEGGLGSVLRQTGITGIWAGLLPRMGMVGVLAALQLLVYDAAKVTLFGLPTSQGIKTHSLSKGLAE